MRQTRETRAMIGMVLACVMLVAVLPPALGQAYTIGPGDVLNIVVVDESTVSGTYTVDPDGDIVLPLAGNIPVKGLTLDEATAKVKDALQPYIKTPSVTVALRTASASDFIYLMGQFSKTGSYKMERGETVAEAVAAAGGTTTRADTTQAFILRKGQTIHVDLQQIIDQGNTAGNIPMQPGDVLIVPETKNQVTVMGQVLKPGNYTFKAGDRVVDVLSAAGGTNSEAVIKDIGVIRQDTAKKEATVIHVDLNKFYKQGDQNQNVPLLPGDILFVPQKGTNWLQVVGQLTGIGTLISIFK
jgi:polysaccharide export outer membrane protein